MTLTEFLLERIAEDERHARKLAENDPRPVLSLASTVNHPERILLECEAKRAIVEFDGIDYDYDGGPWAMEKVHRLLALPYADHDDYDDTWRP